jgi:O-antigen/teichoic acid export membrane protein
MADEAPQRFSSAEKQMNSTHRVVVNTLTTYVRSVFGAGLALFTSRWVLNALGQTDFGLYNVVGSILFFVTFFSATFAAASSRYFAYSIGEGNLEDTNRWFNAALLLHALLAAVLILGGWPIGEYFIKYHLTIPPDRLAASIYVFRLSLISAFFFMVSIPMVSMLTAKQLIYEQAVIGLFQSLLTFVFAYILIRGVEGDRLLFYAQYTVAINVFIQSVYMLRAVAVLPECKLVFQRLFDMGRFRKIISFSGWHATNGIGFALSNQGIAVVLNLFFGPKANAAYGIANQVTNQTSQLSTSLVGAISPEITSIEGSGDRRRMLSLSNRASKFSTLMVLLFVVPILFDTDYLLKLWLKTPPDYAAPFCRIILLAFLLDKITIGYEIAINAIGNVSVLFGVTGLLRIITLPLGYLFVLGGQNPVFCVAAILIMNAAITLFRVYWAGKVLDEPFQDWFMNVAIKCVVASIAASLLALVPFLLMEPSFIRLVLITLMSTSGMALVGWKFSLNDREREYIYENGKKAVLKFKGFLNV